MCIRDRYQISHKLLKQISHANVRPAMHGSELLSVYQTYIRHFDAYINRDEAYFNDLIENAQVIFSDETVVKSLSEKYKYINIDEVQDTSTLEYSIIEKIFNKNNILLCGDMFQTIYEWSCLLYTSRCV